MISQANNKALKSTNKKKRRRKAKFYKKNRQLASRPLAIPRSLRRMRVVVSRVEKQRIKLENSLPDVFSFQEDKESVLSFLNDTFSIYLRHRNQVKEKSFFFNMENVRSIDITAICLFLSLINKLSSNKVGSRGNYPRDETAKDVVIGSGFADIMQSAIKALKTRKYENQLYIVGNKRVDNKKIGKSVREAVGFLTGEENHFKPIYTMLIEICSNSVEHANKKEKDKNWIVSVSYEEEKVNFIVVDTGEGILRTIHKKLPELFIDKVFREDGRVLEDILNKEYQSRTRELNRHKGLPRIKECYDAGYVSDLKILTNNVLYDLSTKSYLKIKNEYLGVLYSWSITRQNYLKWKEKQYL